MPKRDPDSVKAPPFETENLRSNLTRFLNTDFKDPAGGKKKVGSIKWGVYAFFDYEGEPIYVGQTNERLGTRIRRHLTNQRTDAVAMSVLDPFEVFDIEVWPLPDLQNVSKPKVQSGVPWDAWLAAVEMLNALERAVYDDAIKKSRFKAVLNEKDPPPAKMSFKPSPSLRDRVVSPEVEKIRSHPDLRNARRALTFSRLAQVIAERKVQGGLRRVLLTQAKRLQWLAQRRYDALGGAASVEEEDEDEDEEI